MKALIAIVLALTALSASAKSSSYESESSGSGFVPIESAQRVHIFAWNRWTPDMNGEILVCPWDAEPGRKNTCLRNDQNAWIRMIDFPIPGHEVAGFKITHSGGLQVYFRKKK